MTREEMVNAYYTGYDNQNYEEVQKRIKGRHKNGSEVCISSR